MAQRNWATADVGEALSTAASAVRAFVGLRPWDVAGTASGSGEAEREFALGPGWFDSSWELRRGLEIREGLPTDASVDEWLEVALRS